MSMPSTLPFVSVSLLIATALTAQGGWSAPVLETALNSAASDAGPHLSFDGLTLHFSSFRSGNWEIYSSTRPYVGGPWSTPALVTELSDPLTDDQPYLNATSDEIWFSSLRAGGMGGFDILRAVPDPMNPGQWGVPAFVTELNSSGSEASVSLTADGLEVFFLTTGWGAPFAPQNAIFTATRTATNQPFGTPTLVAELSNANTHRDCEISPDGLRVVYTEYVPPSLRVFYAERPDRVTPFSAPVVWTEFDGIGTALGVYAFTLAPTNDEAFLAAGFAAAQGSQEIMSSRRNTYYGVGCGNPPLSLSATVPVLGGAWDITTDNIDPVSPISVTFFGNAPASISLAMLGAPGCIGYIDTLAASVSATNNAGTSIATVNLPANGTLQGLSLTAQSACLTLQNPFNILSSNGLRTTLGF
jgi:hypothetical protein